MLIILKIKGQELSIKSVEKIQSFEGSKLYYLKSDGEYFQLGDKLIQKD